LPLYPYRCTQCGHRFEKIQKFGAKPEEVCPKCGGVLERPLTAPGLQFKGAGWYVNDYAAKSSSSGAESIGSSGSESSGGSGSESAPAEKKSAPDAKAESKPASSAPSAPAATSGPTTS
jgi:putative FmdB family regulatory protein